MKSSPMAKNSSEERNNHQELESQKFFLWTLDPNLSRRFLREVRLDQNVMRPLPERSEWSTLPQDSLVIMVAGESDQIPWDLMAELRQKRSARLILVLSELDSQQWFRLTCRGFVDVLAPPFGQVDLPLAFETRERSVPLSRRLPELDGRIKTKVEFSIPADLQYVSPVAGFISRLAREHTFPVEVWGENLPLAVDEALTNSIVHGCHSDADLEIEIEITFAHEGLKVRIEDPGDGFLAQDLVSSRSGKDLHKPGGRGVLLMTELMDRVRFEAEGRIVTMYVHRHRQHPSREN